MIHYVIYEQLITGIIVVNGWTFVPSIFESHVEINMAMQISPKIDATPKNILINFDSKR